MFKLQILVSVFNLFRNGCRDFRGPRAPETSTLVTDVDARFLQMVTFTWKRLFKTQGTGGFEGATEMYTSRDIQIIVAALK